jgi:hypothetical protein
MEARGRRAFAYLKLASTLAVFSVIVLRIESSLLRA